ncbi:glycosyltransferase [Neobacillus sp. YIM B06451]|uniref:glycosyltransferase family protein n=1 Tax=Neobacillus sp. YIM B06451 TaxID=3070994 RepID=UPI00292D078C|nr:glycosyltransferase [Neobacillus sp. YIM B06451]
MGSFLIDESLHQKIKAIPEISTNHCEHPEIRVACILDTFSFECFKYECNLMQLYLTDWVEKIEAFKPHFLLVESAWRGVNDSWRNLLTSVGKHDHSQIKALIQYCNKKGIPTVFWNKEDPPNFPYFITTAKFFDYVFTTDSNCIPKYQKMVNHERVYPLPFAAQPAVHNPIFSNNSPKENVAFAGTWYSFKHLKRQEFINLLLKPALRYDLKIFDRMYLFKGNKNYQFPDYFQNNIIGYLDYLDMVKAYKIFKVFLNINSVASSPTMFSRRVFELLASGTCVISSISDGISSMFPGIVKVASSEKDVENHLKRLLKNKEEREKLSLLGIREIHKHHLYKHRFEKILDLIGLQYERKGDLPGVSLITVNTSQEHIANILKNYRELNYENKELVVLINEGSIQEDDWMRLINDDDDIQVKKMPAGTTYGESFSAGIKFSRHPYTAVFDEEHYYAPNYLLDTMHAFTWSKAEIVGKSTYYAHVEAANKFVLRELDKEHTFTNFVSGTTMVINKEVFKLVSYPEGNEGTDTKFLKDCNEKGITIYSNDRFNHVRVKSREHTLHSWKISDEEFINKSMIIPNVENFKDYVTV